MKILYVINNGVVGGLQMHVKCLMQSLEGVAETAVVLNTEFDPQVVSLFEDSGLKVYRLRGRSGHDWRIVRRFSEVVEEFKPDVIHGHSMPLLVSLWLLWKRKLPVVQSLHCPCGRPRLAGRLAANFIYRRLTRLWLPVSGATLRGYAEFYPWMAERARVFYNPVRLEEFAGVKRETATGGDMTVGMVGRRAEVKDWPSFHKVEEVVKARMPGVSFRNAGEEAVCDGRAEIARMDLFVMTSKHEEMPTTMLECFAIGTPICGFIPRGGVEEVLEMSDGPLREAFIAERDHARLAEIVLGLLKDAAKREALAEDGRRILERRFDAVKACRGELMEMYKTVVRGDF